MDTNELIRLHAAGYSVLAIAERLGITCQRACGALKNAGCVKRPIPDGYITIRQAAERVGLDHQDAVISFRLGNLRSVKLHGVAYTKPEWVDLWVQNYQWRKNAATRDRLRGLTPRFPVASTSGQ